VSVQVPGHEGNAFVLLNTWLDVVEAIEDGSAATLDISDIAVTGAVAPQTLPSSEAAYATPSELEAAKAWVLEAAMQAGGDQSLTQQSCGSCGASRFAGALRCTRCGTTAEACAVTGYPIPPGEMVELKGTQRVVACRDEFNMYVSVFGSCPLTGTPQTQIQ
jgi:hypothetical protein